MRYYISELIRQLRLNSKDSDHEIARQWKELLEIDITSELVKVRREENKRFQEWMAKSETCTSCEKRISKANSYKWEHSQLEKVGYHTRIGGYDKDANPACVDCQTEFIKDHTVQCVDCSVDVFRRSRTKVRCDNCQDKRHPQISRVSMARARTEKLGLASDLTFEQWTQTLEYYNYSCAYCGGGFEALDHFMPVVRGGGTTWSNCVPACQHCNSVKHDRLPADVFSPGIVVSITEYLNSRGASIVDDIDSYKIGRYNKQ